MRETTRVKERCAKGGVDWGRQSQESRMWFNPDKVVGTWSKKYYPRTAIEKNAREKGGAKC